jgi:hypothetical protein
VFVLIAIARVARAGVDDDLDTAGAWCDGTMVAYDEGAIVASGERIDVRAAAIGCRGGVTWTFAIGGWGRARVEAGSPQPSARAGLVTYARAFDHAGECGAGADPTDVAIAIVRDDHAVRVRCAAWLDRRVAGLAREIAAAIVTPALARRRREARERLSTIDVGDVTLQF